MACLRKTFKDVPIHKHITFTVCTETMPEQVETSLRRIFYRNIEVHDFSVTTESDALDKLEKVDALFLQSGCSIELKSRQCTTRACMSTAEKHAQLQ